ncbi:NRT2 ribosyltransferase, partial [Spelaeornis formosus]|nr:NRT2 ribosyltransferase [Elachura formosa]
WPLCTLLSMALLAHTLALLAMPVATMAITVVPLDMALNSFDDQYLTCGKVMDEKLQELIHADLQNNPLLAQVWQKAVAEYVRRGISMSPLSREQAFAVTAYTTKSLSAPFNTAVREYGNSGQEDMKKFHFKSLHFLLTRAVQKLRLSQCLLVFRGVRNYQYRVKEGDRVRFGQFASTSRSQRVSQSYGRDTMFRVTTCHGADIQRFSFNPSEQEVLVPPFETFVVTKVTQDGGTMNIDLRSSETFSKHNCTWLRGDSLGTAWEDW